MNEWIGGVGYVRLWERVHRAEEALIMVAPIERVIAGALSDELRLLGSAIENREQLLVHLRSSVDVLKVYSGLAAFAPAPAPLALVGPAPPMAPPVYGARDARFARETLRNVRHAINVFRDECRLGLVRARNQLLRTVVVISFVTYLLLALAVGVGVQRETVIAGASFFLVGAVIGLFNRLHLDASAQTAVEDYGLSGARLLHTPIFSGIAAVGGVLIIPMLSALINPGGGIEGNNGTSMVIPSLNDVFNITERPFWSRDCGDFWPEPCYSY